MQDNTEHIVNKIVPFVTHLSVCIEGTLDDLEIAAPQKIKHALILNTLHGSFALKLLQEHPSLRRVYESVVEILTIEREILLEIAQSFEKTENKPFKQSNN